MDQSKCPSCGKSLKGMFAPSLVSAEKVSFINRYSDSKSSSYCSSCAEPIMIQISKFYRDRKEELEREAYRYLQYIPILTGPAPNNWSYQIIGMVTAQNTAGTGFITELSRSFNDFFGAGSSTTNRKILDATNLCKADLRSQAVLAGGNAIISTDIDYNEIGSGSTNMLMVCMAGTAVYVDDLSVFPSKSREFAPKVTELVSELNQIISIKEEEKKLN